MIAVQVAVQNGQALLVRLNSAQQGIKAGLTAGLRAAAISLQSTIKKDYLSGDPVARRSGNLSRAIIWRMQDATTAIVGVGAEAPYARFVNDGTRPHIIAPKNGKALMWQGAASQSVFAQRMTNAAARAGVFVDRARGETVMTGASMHPASGRMVYGAEARAHIAYQNGIFARVVHHPGTKPTRFMQRALAESADNLRAIIAERVNRGLKGES